MARQLFGHQGREPAGGRRPGAMARNVALYPWFKLAQSLLFWQAIWFLFFQDRLSAAEAILLYAIYDLGSTLLEVPSGYLSDRIGRRVTLIVSGVCAALGTFCLAAGDGLAVFALGQALLGAGSAFASGTDSALLFESLNADDRAEATEAQELRAFRFSFAGFALSAATGGALALWSLTAPFWASLAAALVLIGLAWRMTEPPHAATGLAQGGEMLRLRRMAGYFRQPTLRWLFALAALMYGFSHIPFVFGQPFIQTALGEMGLAADAPLVSGLVTAAMMTVSVAVSWVAGPLRDRLGLGAMLMLAFAMQVALAAVLAASTHAAAIAVLLLRMVPDALSGPFIRARLQPLLTDEARASYLSLQALCGRLLFAGSLWIAAGQAADVGAMTPEQIARILGAYAIGGAICLALLGLTLRHAGLEPRK